MPIEHDLSDLPMAEPPPPLTRNIGRQVLPAWLKGAFEHWHNIIDVGPRAKAVPDTLWRSSWSADRCDRQLAYHIGDFEEDTPFDLADFWRTNLGKVVGLHLGEYISQAIEENPDVKFKVEVEVPADLREGKIEMDGSSSIEILVLMVDVSGATAPYHVIELKTINGMGFKEVSLGWKSGNAKPRYGHLVQTCVEAANYGVDATLVYIATELIGAGIAASKGLQPLQRFATAWRFTADECMVVAGAEKERIEAVASTVLLSDPGSVQRRIVAPGDYPENAVITNPLKGMWVVADDTGAVVDSGSCWYCDYCSFRKTCVRDGA